MHRLRCYTAADYAQQKQADSLGEAELRIFDAHLAYLGDAMFVTEIETQIINERLSAREAVQGVFAKYDRIFSLVESDLLRRRASDLRDVATRLLRNIESDAVRGRLAAAGFTVANGYGKLKGKAFRIGHMGDQNLATLDRLLATIDA